MFTSAAPLTLHCNNRNVSLKLVNNDSYFEMAAFVSTNFDCGSKIQFHQNYVFCKFIYIYGPFSVKTGLNDIT